jgi:hypothetical protein
MVTLLTLIISKLRSYRFDWSRATVVHWLEVSQGNSGLDLDLGAQKIGAARSPVAALPVSHRRCKDPDLLDGSQDEIIRSSTIPGGILSTSPGATVRIH